MDLEGSESEFFLKGAREEEVMAPDMISVQSECCRISYQAQMIKKDIGDSFGLPLKLSTAYSVSRTSLS